MAATEPVSPRGTTASPASLLSARLEQATQCVPMSLRSTSSPIPAHALTDAQIDQLQRLLDAVPAPLEPLGADAVDGWLAGVVLQPRTVPESAWLKWVFDVDGRALPASYDPAPLRDLLQHRYRQIESAIARRQWFDPVVFEHEKESLPSEAVMGWVAGFATAMEHFPAMLDTAGAAATEPLALLYRHLDPEDLEDADDLLEEIETLEPPANLSEAVEDLVRGTLLLADLSRPLGPPPERPSRRSHARRPRT